MRSSFLPAHFPWFNSVDVVRGIGRRLINHFIYTAEDLVSRNVKITVHHVGQDTAFVVLFVERFIEFSPNFEFLRPAYSLYRIYKLYSKIALAPYN